MNSTRCDLTELPADMCAHCLGHADPEGEAAQARARKLGRPRWIAAAYRGRCIDCGEFYEPGTPITHIEERQSGRLVSGWRAECCG